MAVTVAVVRYEALGQSRVGVTSTLLSDRLQVPLSPHAKQLSDRLQVPLVSSNDTHSKSRKISKLVHE